MSRIPKLKELCQLYSGVQNPETLNRLKSGSLESLQNPIQSTKKKKTLVQSIQKSHTSSQRNTQCIRRPARLVTPAAVNDVILIGILLTLLIQYAEPLTRRYDARKKRTSKEPNPFCRDRHRYIALVYVWNRKWRTNRETVCDITSNQGKTSRMRERKARQAHFLRVW